MTTDNLFASLAGFVDQSALAFMTEETKEGINRARLIQGDIQFEKDATFNQTVRYTGGIGLSLDGLPEEIQAQGTIIKTENNDWAVFKELEVVILATSRNRRKYGEHDGKKGVLLCGSNNDGFHATGWSGTDCKACPFHKKNMQAAGKSDKEIKDDSCRSNIAALIYIPAFDHTAIFTGNGASYMPTAEWLDQISLLSKALAKKQEFQAANPGLTRTNPFFFKNKLFAGPFQKSKDNNSFNALEFSKAVQPYDWAALINEPEVIKRASEIMTDLTDVWKQMYVDTNTSAVFAQLAGSTQPAALPAQSSAERVTVPALPAEVQSAPAQVVQAPVPAPAPAMPAPAPAQIAQPAPAPVATPAPVLTVNTVPLDDVDSVPALDSVIPF